MRAISILLLSLGIISNSVVAQLTDYQRFVSYPYLEKTYRLQARGQYAQAIEELKLAIAVAPNHPPYQILLFELLIANDQTKQAMALYSSFTFADKGPILASLIETQIQQGSLQLTDDLKLLIEDTSLEQRTDLYLAVTGNLIANGQESVAYNWLDSLANLPLALKEVQIRLADKTGQYGNLQKYYLSIPKARRSNEMERLFIFSLLKSGKTQQALDSANLNPKSKLSFDVYYQFLQDSIAKNNKNDVELAFVWIEKNHRLEPALLEQRFEQAIKNKNRKTAFKTMQQLNIGCEKRIDVALTLNWQSKVEEELLRCQDIMQESVWITHAKSIFSTQKLSQLVDNNTKHSTAISKALIERYVAQRHYKEAINEIKRTKTQEDFAETLAYSYEKLGQMALATEQFVKLYNRYKTDDYLAKSSFLLVKLNRNVEALSLLEKRLLTDPVNMPKELIERIVEIYLQFPTRLSPIAIDSLVKTQYSHNMTAEMLRINGSCKEALFLLESNQLKSAQSWQTRAMCVQNDSPILALTYWQNANNLTNTHTTLRGLAYAQGENDDVQSALQSLYKIKQKNWTKADTLYAAQLHYRQQDFQSANTLWQLADEGSEAWLNFGIELAIKFQKYTVAQSLSQQLFELKDEFNGPQWARQATIYQYTGQKNKAIRAWELAVEQSPDQSQYQISWAYSLIHVAPEKAYDILLNFTKNNTEIDSTVWEQLSYLAAGNLDQLAAVNYAQKSIESAKSNQYVRNQQSTWDLYQNYRNLSQNWRFSASVSHGSGSILGEVFFNELDGQQAPPTNNIISRAEYFFNTTKQKWSTYIQISGNGNDDDPLSEWSQELGVSYRIFDQFNIKATVGTQRFLTEDWQPLFRLNGDVLNQGSWRPGWRFDDSWWQRQLYFEYLVLPNSNQQLGLVRYDHGYVNALNTSSKQTIMYYGLAQFDYRRFEQVNMGDSQYTQSALGIGIRWSLFTTPDVAYDRVHTYSLGLEWRLNVAGNLTDDNNSLFLQATYQY